MDIALRALAKAEVAAEERVLDALVGETASAGTRDSFRTKLRKGELNEKEIEIENHVNQSRIRQHTTPRDQKQIQLCQHNRKNTLS